MSPEYTEQESTPEERLGQLNRSLPFSDEAEKGVLSGILQDPQHRLPECAAKLPVDVFYHQANRLVFATLCDFMQRDVPVDIATLTHALRDAGALEKAGGPGALAELYGFIPIAAHFEFHRRIVIDKWLLRQFIAACAEGIAMAQAHGRDHVDEPALSVLALGEEKVFAVLQRSMDINENSAGPVKAAQFMNSYVDHLEKVMANVGRVVGLQTGLVDVDRVICGLDDNRGELFIIGARPGHGKTALLGTLLKNMCVDQHIPTLMFSMEMSTDQLMDRVVFGGFDINTSKARTGMLNQGEKRDLGTNIKKVQGCPLWIDESGELTTVEFRARVDMMVRQQGIKLLIIDYVQLLEPCSKVGKSEERLAIAEALKAIHALKKKHKLIILCAAQLNQNIEKTPGRRHVLSDFAGSDTIGKYADYALFITRPAEIKRWKDLQPKTKETQIKRWEQARKDQPDMWAGHRVKEPGEHPAGPRAASTSDDDDLDFDNSGHKAKRNKGATKSATDSADEGAGDLLSTMLTCHDQWGWVFDNEKDWDESAELQFVKNRHGPTPDVAVRFRREFARFDTRTPKHFSNNARERQH